MSSCSTYSPVRLVGPVSAAPVPSIPLTAALSAALSAVPLPAVPVTAALSAAPLPAVLGTAALSAAPSSGSTATLIPLDAAKDFPNNRNLRRYILITLSHGESRGVSSEMCCNVVLKLFPCTGVIVAKERHDRGGYHYHIGVRNEGASRKTATKLIRRAFPEFEGRQCNVSFHKGWNSICQYVLKQDESPLCWGEPLEEIKARARAYMGKGRGPDLVKLLREKANWSEVLSDECLSKKCVTSYSSVYNTFIDLKALESKEHFLTRLSRYVRLNPSRSSYTEEELKEKWGVIDWLVFNLCRDRHLKQAQMLIIGKPNTHKTNLVQELSKFLSVFFLPLRKDDFSGATNEDDLWVIDEFREGRLSESALLMILDGQRVGLDNKYGKVFEKVKNIPIMVLTNDFSIKEGDEGFWSRVKKVDFVSTLDTPIEADRLARTIYEKSKVFLIAAHGASFVSLLEGCPPLVLELCPLDKVEKVEESVIYVGMDPTVVYCGEFKEESILCFPPLKKQVCFPPVEMFICFPIKETRRGRPRKWVNPMNAVVCGKGIRIGDIH